jgi:hypothetical protein
MIAQHGGRLMSEDDPNWLGQAESKRDYLNKWLSEVKNVNEVAPLVKQNLDYTDWLIRTVRSRPQLDGMPPLPDLFESTGRDLSYLYKVLPALESYMKPAMMSSTSLGSAIVAPLFGYTQVVSRLGSPAAIRYASEAKASLEKLDSVYQKIDELRALIRKLGSGGLDERFDRARASYESCRIGTTDRIAAASNMRTLLHGVEGELYERARKQPKEDMTWQRMSRRLAPESPQYETVLLSEQTFSKLLSTLSDVLKDREGETKANLEAVWLEMQSFLIAVIGSITI